MKGVGLMAWLQPLLGGSCLGGDAKTPAGSRRQAEARPTWLS
jgi:hypothetical protein